MQTQSSLKSKRYRKNPWFSRATAFAAVAAFGASQSLLLACATSRNYVWSADYVRTSEAKAPVVLRPGDKLQIVVAGQENLSGSVEVRPDGEIVLPVAGSITAANQTPAELASAITSRIRGIIAAPVVTVVVEHHQTQVTVLGEVRLPGQYELGYRDGVLGALAKAGGLTQFADTEGIFVLRRDPKASRIRFSYDDLTAANDTTLSFTVRDGDIIVVE